MGSLSLDHYHFYFLMILNEKLTFLSLLNPILQYLNVFFTDLVTLPPGILSIISSLYHQSYKYQQYANLSMMVVPLKR